jgi:hypothetical protein
MLFPEWFIDEALTIHRVNSYVHEGLAVRSLDTSVFLHKGHPLAKVPNLPYMIYSIPHAIGMDVTIDSMRAMSFAGGLLLVVTLGLIAKRAWGNIEAMFVTATAITSFIFIDASHLGRPDIIAIATAYLGMLFLLYGRWSGVFFGFLSLTALGIHERAIIIVAPCFFTALFDLKNKGDRRLFFATTACGAAVGVLFLFFVNIVPNGGLHEWVDYYVNIWNGSAIPLSRMKQTSSSFAFWQTTYEYVASVEPLVFVAFFSALLMVRKDRESLRIFFLLGMIIVLGLGLVDMPHPVKLITYYPAIWLLIARAFALSCKRIYEGRDLAISRVAFVLIASYACGNSLSLLNFSTNIPSYCRSESDFLKAQLNQLKLNGRAVIAHDMFLLWIPDQLVGSWDQLKQHMQATGESADVAIDKFKIDALILDPKTKARMSDQPSNVSFLENYRLPLSEVERIRTRPTSSSYFLESKCLGRVEVLLTSQQGAEATRLPPVNAGLKSLL